MKHTTYQSRSFILSRDRLSGIELVDPKTGELVVVSQDKRSELGPVVETFLDVVPNLQHFPARPTSFLTELRLRREEYLRQARTNKRQSRKVEKSSGQKPRQTQRKVSVKLNETISKLPPNLQELFRQASLKKGKL